MKREEKIELLKQKLVEYINKRGIDSNFTYLLGDTKAAGLKEVFNYICNKIIESGQAIFIFRLIDDVLIFRTETEDEELRKRLISALIETKDAEYICRCLIRKQYDLDKETIEKLEQALVKTNSTKDIINYIHHCKDFTDCFVSLIIETKNPELIYTLAVDYYYDEDVYDRLVQALIETDNIEYIKALADYFNNYMGNTQLNKKIYDYLNTYLPYVQGAEKAKLMNIRNEYETDFLEENEDSQIIERIIDEN